MTKAILALKLFGSVSIIYSIFIAFEPLLVYNEITQKPTTEKYAYPMKSILKYIHLKYTKEIRRESELII